MNKAEYKKISHDIRYAAFRDARYRTEKTGKNHTTRGILYNIMCALGRGAIRRKQGHPFQGDLISTGAEPKPCSPYRRTHI